SFDWTVLGIGAAVLILGLGAVAVALSLRGAPHRVAARQRNVRERTSVVARASAASGMPVPAVTRIRFALEPGAGRNAVPVRSEPPNAAIGPPTLTGAGLTGADQIVVGALTLAQLHKHVGDTVEVSAGDSPATALRIVGTATMPTMGSGGTEHLQMGTGA